MLHPSTDYYDLSSNKQTPPSFSPQQGASVLTNNMNNNDNDLDMIGQNGNINNNDRESLPSFGFTQEQVACVCEVSIRIKDIGYVLFFNDLITVQ